MSPPHFLFMLKVKYYKKPSTVYNNSLLRQCYGSFFKSSVAGGFEIRSDHAQFRHWYNMCYRLLFLRYPRRDHRRHYLMLRYSTSAQSRLPLSSLGRIGTGIVPTSHLVNAKTRRSLKKIKFILNQ